MDFLKKHYEKMLLLAMLLLFICIMIYVMQVAQRAKSVSDKDLALPEFKPNYKPVDSKSSLFNQKQVLLIGQPDWKRSVQRQKTGGNDTEGLFSDLTEVFAVASCPHKGRAGEHLVPRYYFNGGNCPVCGGELHVPPDRPKERRNMPTENDLDGDGMPNAYETENGLDPKDSGDQRGDLDRDGFSNLFEYEMQTSPKNARSRMPLWYRLRFKDVRRIELPVKFMALNDSGSKNPKDWSFQINTPVMRRGKPVMDRRSGKVREETAFRSIGDAVKIEDRTYKIVRAELLREDKGKGNILDKSKIYLEEQLQGDRAAKHEKPDLLVMQAGGVPVYSNDERLVVEDIGLPENKRPQFILAINGALQLGNRTTGTERYILRQIKRKEGRAYFDRLNVKAGEDPTRDVRGKKIVVTRSSEIPDDLWVMEVKKREKNGERGQEGPESSSRR